MFEPTHSWYGILPALRANNVGSHNNITQKPTNPVRNQWQLSLSV